LEQPRAVKSEQTILKFGTFLDWLYTSGLFCLFFKSFFLGSWDPFFPKTIWDSLEKLKMANHFEILDK